VGWKDELARVAVVGEAPAAEVGFLVAGVVEFEPIVGAVSAAGVRAVPGQDFVKADTAGDAWAGPCAGRSAWGGARAPVGWVAEVGIGVDEFDGSALAVGLDGPAGGIAVFEAPDLATVAVFEGEGLAAVGEGAAVGAKGWDTWVTGGEGGWVGVRLGTGER